MNKEKTYITEKMLLNKKLEFGVMDFLFYLKIPLSVPRNFSSVEYSHRKYGLLALYDTNIHAILDFCFVNNSLCTRFMKLNVDDIVQGLKDDERYHDLYEMLFVIDTVINNIPEGYE
jgi:hypothetical protein